VTSLENWIKNYLNVEGRLISFPSKRKLKIAAMFYIDSLIEPWMEKFIGRRTFSQLLNNMICINPIEKDEINLLC
jgi:hypothetical protein